MVWFVNDVSQLSEEAVVEAVLSNGNWDDVQKLIHILGMQKTGRIFRAQLRKTRNNYHPKIANYFSLYFKKHA